ncbi:hypothetical protein [Candidatus Hakubella thermalkaliphila]|nr:hypothetical protein [Candidatus Hakubella thermalkaliphila]
MGLRPQLFVYVARLLEALEEGRKVPTRPKAIRMRVQVKIP